MCCHPVVNRSTPLRYHQDHTGGSQHHSFVTVLSARERSEHAIVFHMDATLGTKRVAPCPAWEVSSVFRRNLGKKSAPIFWLPFPLQSTNRNAEVSRKENVHDSLVHLSFLGFVHRSAE